MILRYTRKEMGHVWSEANRFQKWLEVELAATDTLAGAGLVPKATSRYVPPEATDVSFFYSLNQSLTPPDCLE